MPNGWHKRCNKNFCSRKFRRGGSSRYSKNYWGRGINSYGFVGGGSSSRRKVGNSRQSNPGCRCPCHPAIKQSRVRRVQRVWEAHQACHDNEW